MMWLFFSDAGPVAVCINDHFKPCNMSVIADYMMKGFAEAMQLDKCYFKVPYLLEYKSHSCISRTPTLELKIGTKLF